MHARRRQGRLLVLVTVVFAPVACAKSATPTIDAGRTLYLQNGCASCHGPEGHGDGPIGRTLTPTPRDFRDLSAFKQGTTTDAIARTIAVGVAGGGQMPPFAHLTEAERQSVALYVLSVSRSSPPAGTQP
jgi:high-affinity iron transporter